MSERVKVERICEEESISEEELEEMPFAEAIIALKALEARVRARGYDHTRLSIDYENPYDEDYTIKILGVRSETDLEMEGRLRMEKHFKELEKLHEDAERAEYERLKAKFEP